MDELNQTQETPPEDAISEDRISAVESVALDAPPDPDAAPDDAHAREADGEHPPGPAPERVYSWEERTRESRRFCTGLVGAAVGTAEILDTPIPITEAQIQELGEVWGNFLRHFVEIQEGELKADTARALGETGIIGREIITKMAEEQDG